MRGLDSMWLTYCILMVYTLSSALPIPSKSLRRDVFEEYEEDIDGLMYISSGEQDYFCSSYKIRDILYDLRTIARGDNCKERIVFDDCCQPAWLQMTTSGIYSLEAPLNQMAYCDMEQHGGGWTVVLRRIGGKRSFNRNWLRYERGFGKLDKDFWLGLIALHRLSVLPGGLEVRIELIMDNGTIHFAHYDHFHVAGGQQDKYRLSVGGYDNHSTLVDFLDNANGLEFSTEDQDNDNVLFNCALLNKGGWWYGKRSGRPICAPLGGIPTSAYEPGYGIAWPVDFSTVYYRQVEMKVRPKSWHCRNLYQTTKVQNDFVTLQKHYPHLVEEDGSGSGEE